MNKLTGELGR